MKQPCDWADIDLISLMRLNGLRDSLAVALITGVIIHRRLLREFFTLRPWKQPQRLTLDLHNLTGVVALPFHFFFAFTGLVIFAGSIYLPVTHTLLRPMHDQQHQIEARNTGLPAQRAGVAARGRSALADRTRGAARGYSCERRAAARRLRRLRAHRHQSRAQPHRPGQRREAPDRRHLH